MLQKLSFIERETSRLRNPDLMVAFVGGFSAGKSSIINALPGQYLLPESTEVTTAVPTYIKRGNQNRAEIHYLNSGEIEVMQKRVRDESEAMFLDRVEVFINTDRIPPDVVLVDLPAVSVLNPRHRSVTFLYLQHHKMPEKFF